MSVSRFMVYGILRLQWQEAPPMAGLRFAALQSRPTEFQPLVPPFEAMFMTSALPTRRRIPCPRGAGCCRSRLPALHAAPGRVSSCRPRNHVARNLPWNSNWPTRPCTIADCIEHVNSRVKRCRIVKDRIRLWKEGVRDVVMDICCALHNFQVCLTPWQPMV